jgi:reactive intermediate/imine deaminase
MSEKVSIWAEDAPQPFGHYCQAMKMGNTVYMSGQLPIDPASGKPIQGDIEAQAKRVFDNMAALLQAAGGQLSNIVTTTLYLTDLRDFPAFDKVSKDYFFFLPPARTTVCVAALPGGAKVCMDAIALLKAPSEAKPPTML